MPLGRASNNGMHPTADTLLLIFGNDPGRRVMPSVMPLIHKRMLSDLKPYQIIEHLVELRKGRSDADILAELEALPPLCDEEAPCRDAEAYWLEVAYPYLALADIVAARRLPDAIPMLLDRACLGDPGEIMRGLHHCLEAAVSGDGNALADICLSAARSERPGTRLWAIDELAMLDDPRARSIFEEAIRVGPEELRWRAQIGLERLGGAAA